VIALRQPQRTNPPTGAKGLWRCFPRQTEYTHEFELSQAKCPWKQIHRPTNVLPRRTAIDRALATFDPGNGIAMHRKHYDQNSTRVEFAGCGTSAICDWWPEMKIGKRSRLNYLLSSVIFSQKTKKNHDMKMARPSPAFSLLCLLRRTFPARLLHPAESNRYWLEQRGPQSAFTGSQF